MSRHFNTVRSSRLLFAAYVIALLGACPTPTLSGDAGPGEVPPDAAGIDAGGDAGVANVGADSGIATSEDAGARAGGSAHNDAGPSRADAGAPPDTDAGAPSVDGGAPTFDAGIMWTDSGVAYETDGGPFSAHPDVSEGLVNVSADLNALLENGALSNACALWEAEPDNVGLKIRCGKAMFFYEGFGTIGVPTALFDFFGNRFPEITGTAWSAYGLIPDPTQTDPARPLGVAPGAPFSGVDTQAFTCASCHFGQLPDGRYAVGAANYDYEYGKQILAISLPASSVGLSFDPNEHHPDAIAAVQPIIDTLADDFALRIELLFDLLPLIGAAQPEFDVDTEGNYAHWKSGTMDFLMTPLPVDDGVHTVSKIIPLWGLATDAEIEAHEMPHAMLAWSGGARSLMEFLRSFVAIGDGSDAEWPDSRLEPLADYILSLRAPASRAPLDEAAIENGAVLFETEGCLDCHAGPRGGGTEVYTFEEIGTDDAMRAWADPDLDGYICCGLGSTDEMLTHGIKSPRLRGLWAATRLLHNGSVDSLEELLCVDGPREPITEYAFGNAGHTYGCDTLNDDEKADLLAFLNRL